MARSYDARTVALTIGQSPKWVDNLLSHYELPGVVRARQGVQRTISDDGLLAIEMTRLLAVDMGVPLARATSVIREAMACRLDGETKVVTDSGLVLTFQLATIERRLRDKVTDAMESVARIRRGRRPNLGSTRG